MSESRIEPPEVVMAVEHYIEGELRDARRYSNRRPLDESGIWSLHSLAARIWALGWRAGETSAAERARFAQIRHREQMQAAGKTDSEVDA